MKAWNGRKMIRRIVKSALFLLIFAVLFYGVQRLLQAKWLDTDNECTSMWIEYGNMEQDSIDVLYIGTSHMYSAVDPMYVYENSGITGFVLAGGSQRFDLTYLSLKEALATQSPSVVFLDMSALHYGGAQDEALAHRILDNLSLSITKITYAFHNANTDMSALDVLFPFFRYHSRWDELEESDYKYLTGNLEETYKRGHFLSYTVKSAEMRFYEDDGKSSKFRSTDYDLEYLRKIGELCKENGIDLILCKVPTPAWYKPQSDAAYELAEEMGVYYWEMYYELEEIGIDASTDFRDSKDHLNQYGAEKVSAYIMQYLLENYDLEDQRDTNTQWNEDLAAYKELLASMQ